MGANKEKAKGVAQPRKKETLSDGETVFCILSVLPRFSLVLWGLIVGEIRVREGKRSREQYKEMFS